MLAKLSGFALNGIDGFAVEVEADINNGLPAFETVGLPDAAIKESKERVRSAIRNSGYRYPTTRITINLAPADVRKVGPIYDLPIALCILAASEQLDFRAVKPYCFFGELALDGRVRRVNGILPLLIAARAAGVSKVVLSSENVAEASFLEGLEVYGVETLAETVAFLRGEKEIAPAPTRCVTDAINSTRCAFDFKFVKGQYRAKRAMEIAAAGGHNLLMIGPPGAGKTMLARALPGILPDMSAEEALETTKIHSVAGKLDPSVGIVTERPFRTPHHTSTVVALTGGGNSARPGEISLAHNGVLFLDELPEYGKNVLETLRQPLEDGVISIARNARSVEYPADFMLVAGMNPCPCGFYGSEKGTCTCSPSMIRRYLSRLSGPLLDRIDLQVGVDSVEYDDLATADPAEPSAAVKVRVDAARAVQRARYAGTGTHCNAKMTAEQTTAYCRLDAAAESLMRKAFDSLNLSARGYNRVLRVARTIADLAGQEAISPAALAEALQYRALDKKYTI